MTARAVLSATTVTNLPASAAARINLKQATS
jgi:hypothetical protein